MRPGPRERKTCPGASSTRLAWPGMAFPETNAACSELPSHLVDMFIHVEPPGFDAARTAIAPALTRRAFVAPSVDAAPTAIASALITCAVAAPSAEDALRPFACVGPTLEPALRSIDPAGPSLETARGTLARAPSLTSSALASAGTGLTTVDAARTRTPASESV
jgi:hypothetical protein